VLDDRIAIREFEDENRSLRATLSGAEKRCEQFYGRVQVVETERDEARAELAQLDGTLAGLDEAVREAIIRAGRATGYAEWKGEEANVAQLFLDLMRERDEAMEAAREAVGVSRFAIADDKAATWIASVVDSSWRGRGTLYWWLRLFGAVIAVGKAITTGCCVDSAEYKITRVASIAVNWIRERRHQRRAEERRR